jgi:hypothetical protein
LEFFLRFSSSGGCERVNELQVNFARGADIFFVFSVPPEKSQDKEKFRLMENRLNSSTHSQSSEKENRNENLAAKIAT